jgi:hypothetical protein
MAGFEQRKGIRAEEIAHLHRQPFRRCWRVRQRQAVERQQHEQVAAATWKDGNAGRHAGHADENPATIQPMVPNTRTTGKVLSTFARL